MTGYVKKYHSTEEAEAYQQKLQYNEFVGWRGDVPEPFAARPEEGIQLHWHEKELKKKNTTKMDMK